MYLAKAKAKGRTYQDMYEHLSTKEGVNENFKLARALNKRAQYICSIRYCNIPHWLDKKYLGSF